MEMARIFVRKEVKVRKEDTHSNRSQQVASPAGRGGKPSFAKTLL